MNKPLTDAELQTRMMEYNSMVVGRIASLFTTPAPRAIGEADDEHSADCERLAMDKFYKALAAFRSSVQDAQALTDQRKTELGFLLDALDDYTPSRDKWEEDVQREKMAGIG